MTGPQPSLALEDARPGLSSPRPLSRQALYDMVWNEPPSVLAANLGISRNGLAKICDRLLIPYPGRGYWAKSEREKAAARPPLPPPPTDAEGAVTIGGSRSVSRRPRQRLPRDFRRDQFIAAAAAIIVKDGLNAATMKRVAREVGVSEAQAHNYFSRQADLLIAVARRELEAMNAIRQAEVERGHDNLTRVTLSTITYLRQVDQRGALIQTLLNSPEVRAGLRADRAQQSLSARDRMTERLTSRYNVPADMAAGATVILTAVCLRAGRLLADRRISLELAERLSLAIVTAGNRSVVASARTAGA